MCPICHQPADNHCFRHKSAIICPAGPASVACADTGPRDFTVPIPSPGEQGKLDLIGALARFDPLTAYSLIRLRQQVHGNWNPKPLTDDRKARLEYWDGYLEHV